MNPQHNPSNAWDAPAGADLGIGPSEFESKALHELFFSIAGEDLQQSLALQLREILSVHPQLRAGLIPFSDYVRNTRIPQSFAVYLDRDRDALPTLLQILSIDSNAVQWLVDDPDSFDWLRLSAGQSVDRSHLIDVIQGEIQSMEDESQVASSLNRFRKRETLRVICGTTLHDMQVEIALEQLSWIADAGIQAALSFAQSERKHRHGGNESKESVPIGIIGLGGLGGFELDLSGHVDLLFLVEGPGAESRPAGWMESTERLVQRAMHFIGDASSLSYQVGLPMDDLEPENARAGTVHEYQQWMQSIEQHGRTWQRLLLMKGRSIGGDPRFTQQILQDLPSLVYRRYLNRADIAGIGAVKRKIDRTSRSADASLGSITSWEMAALRRSKQEIEFLIQFLQLINGGELERVRTSHTLLAIEMLAHCRCLTEQERAILHQAYVLICRTILALQIRSIASNRLELPARSASELSLDSVAPGLRYQAAEDRSHGDGLHQDLSDAWQRVQQIRNHLRGEVFVDESQAAEETDLVLDPDPPKVWVDQLLAKWGFVDTGSAYRNLTDLGREEVSMLSTRRCRHFLSTIAPQLLSKIGQTPDPDLTLENLSLSCRSLGAKGILWELFSVHEPSMNLYVRLCGASSYLIGILTSHPGMIDELLDSLMLNRLPTDEQLSRMLRELCRGANDTDPIVHAFKSAMHLNVGVRDILGKESISRTHRALSDIADACLQQVIDEQYQRLVQRHGLPTRAEGMHCRYGVLATGKLGGREPNYHSDLTILFLYDAIGETKPIGPLRHCQPIDAELFFHQLAQKVSQSVNRLTRSGRLYELKSWMVSEHQNSTLAWRIDEFSRFFAQSPSTALQRQQLCNARVIHGDDDFGHEVMATIHGILGTVPWTPDDTREIREARTRSEETASPHNLKRGVGGTMDVETLVQWLVLTHPATIETGGSSGTLETIARLQSAQVLGADDAARLRAGYDFLRSVESGLRLMNTSARHDLPTDPRELARLAYVLHIESGERLASECASYRQSHRELLDKYMNPR